MDRIENTTKTYKYNDYLIDIVETDEDFEAWIYTSDLGIKHIMFGMPKKQQSLDEFMDIVEANIDDYTYMVDEDI